MKYFISKKLSDCRSYLPFVNSYSHNNQKSKDKWEYSLFFFILKLKPRKLGHTIMIETMSAQVFHRLSFFLKIVNELVLIIFIYFVVVTRFSRVSNMLFNNFISHSYLALYFVCILHLKKIENSPIHFQYIFIFNHVFISYKTQ